MKIILICAQGRSASTTLLRVLNTIDGCNICGENWGAIINLMDFYSNIKKTSKQPSLIKNRSLIHKKKPCWYNVYDQNEIKKLITRMVIRMYKGNQYRIIGYKEIRHGLREGYDSFERRLNDFRELFPKAKIIFLYRKDLNGQLKSEMWKKNPDAKRLLTVQKNSFTKYHNKHKKFTFMLTMEDIIHHSGNMKNLYRFIGEPYSKTKIDIVLKNDLEKKNKKNKKK